MPKTQAKTQEISERVNHSRRVAHLCRLIGERLSLQQHSAALPESGDPQTSRDAKTLELCNAFDQAIEFAAFERSSVPQAITEFLGECSAYHPDAVRGLAEFCLPRFTPDLQIQIPVMPQAAAKLMRTKPDTTTVSQLEAIATADAVLAAKLLGAANSAQFGSRFPITQLHQAILRVGIPFGRKVLLNACVGGVFASATLNALWKHSQAVAAVSHEIARRVGLDSELAYTAGLLHDIGRVLLERCPSGAQARTAELIANSFPITYAETLVHGMDHAQLGGQLLRQWGVPHEIAAAVSDHHRPEATDSCLAGILYLAEVQCSAKQDAEALSYGMRQAAASVLTGVRLKDFEIDRGAQIFALAG